MDYRSKREEGGGTVTPASAALSFKRDGDVISSPRPLYITRYIV